MRLRLILCFASLLVAETAAAGAVVPVRAIRGQSVISASDVTLSDEQVPGAIAALDAVIGREARVTLYPGRPILRDQVGAPALVERNALVRMVYDEGGLSITVDGRVLDRGGVGEIVRVMNLASRQIVSGMVTATGTVEVGE